MLESLPAPAGRSQSIEAFNAGVRAMVAGDGATAARAWEAASGADAALVPAHYNIAIWHEERNDWARAGAAWKRLLAADPYDTRALVRLSVALRSQGDAAGALKVLEVAVRLYPYFKSWYDDMAALLDQVGRSGEATMWRSRGEKLDTDAVEMALDDGVRNLRQGNWDLACACLEAILEDWPENVDARIRLAQAQAGSGQIEAAVASLRAALQHADAGPARVHYQLGRILAHAGQTEAAVGELQRALKLEPNYGLANELLARLRFSPGTPDAQRSNPSSSVRTGAMSAYVRVDSATSNPPHGEPPVFAAPDVTQPWEDRVRSLIRQASLLPGPTGRPPRVALIVERNSALAPLAAHVAAVLSGPELTKMPDGAQPVFVVESDVRPGEVAGGWLGSDAYPTLDVARWPQHSEPLAIDELLAAVSRAAGTDGFNLVLIVSSGRVRPDQNNTSRAIRGIQAYQFASVAPTGRSTDLALRFGGVAPNWAEIVV